MNDIWNPWHGCRKYSEGCDHCYMYFLDREHHQDGSIIYRVKNNFDYPVRKDRMGNYAIPSGATIRVCMTSDFFLEEADPWREEAWDLMRRRPDVLFWLLTKRAFRIRECLPGDWGDGWKNVALNVTAENQQRADERIPILLDIPAAFKGIMTAPMVGPVEIDRYLRTGQILTVLCDGENYDGMRPLHYEWVQSLSEQCRKYNVNFEFIGTGNVFVKDGKTYRIRKDLQMQQARKSGLSNPVKRINFEYQQMVTENQFSLFPEAVVPYYKKKCGTCPMRSGCSGCTRCGKCSG